MMRALVIGAGDMGRKHAAAYRALENVTLAGVADPDGQRAKVFVHNHAGAVQFSNSREAINEIQPDIVSVCLPAFLHKEVSVAALEAGAYVLCEKPIALTLEDAEAMVAAASRNEDRLGIVLQRRYAGAWAFAGKRIGDLGTPLIYHATDFRQVRPKLLMHSRGGNGGPVVDCAVHDFDRALEWFGPAVSVQAVGTIFAEGKPEVATVADLAIDTSNILVQFEAGHMASIQYGWGMPTGFNDYVRNEIVGPLGMLRVFEDRVEHHKGGGLVETRTGFSDDGHARQIAAFVEAIRSESPLPVSPNEARAASVLSHAALDAIDTGNVVAVG